jgi:hypothetical protein
MKTLFQCCFCGQTIEPVGADVGGIVYITNADTDEKNHYSQQLYCHTSCFKERLHSSVNLYVLDLVDDLEENIND